MGANLPDADRWGGVAGAGLGCTIGVDDGTVAV
jgi:hypothetical protein